MNKESDVDARVKKKCFIILYGSVQRKLKVTLNPQRLVLIQGRPVLFISPIGSTRSRRQQSNVWSSEGDELHPERTGTVSVRRSSSLKLGSCGPEPLVTAVLETWTMFLMFDLGSLLFYSVLTEAELQAKQSQWNNSFYLELRVQQHFVPHSRMRQSRTKPSRPD